MNFKYKPYISGKPVPGVEPGTGGFNSCLMPDRIRRNHEQSRNMHPDIFPPKQPELTARISSLYCQ